MRALAVCLLMLLPLARGESGPSDAAVAFLIEVARERVDLEKDTAIAPGTTKEKRSAIRTNLKQLSALVDQGDLRVIDERIKGELAAVLVSRIIDYDPSQVQVFAVAMLKRDDRWLPAPVLASFENTGITYLPGLSKTSRELEQWMFEERTVRLARLRNDIQTDLKSDIQKALSIEELREFSPEQIVLNFIDACQSMELPTALAYLGGLEEPLPENWDDLLLFMSTNIRRPDQANPAWRQVVDTTDSRAVVKTDVFQDGAMVSIGSFAPFASRSGEPAVRILHFPLDRSNDGLWRLRLPSWLTEGVVQTEPLPGDEELIEAFPTKLAGQLPPASFPTPEALMESFLQALSSPRFEAVMPLIGLPESGDVMTRLERAAELWRDLKGRDGVAPLLLEIHRKDPQACALLSQIDARNPKISPRLIRRIHLEKTNDLWSITSSLNQTPAGTDPDLVAWADEASRLSEADWLKRLGLTAILDDIPADSAPSEESAQAAADTWLSAIRARDPRAILRSAATFDDEGGIRRLFRTIGHELQSHRQTSILKIHRNGRWAAASVVAISSDRHDDPYHLLYPIVGTPSGPRILVESVLFHADNRSLEFLNSTAWKRLESRLPEAAVAELKEIQKAHTALAETP